MYKCRKLCKTITCVGLFVLLASCSNHGEEDHKQGNDVQKIEEDTVEEKNYEELKYTYQESYPVKYIVDIPDYVMSWNIGHCIHLGDNKMILFDNYMDFGYEDYGYKLEDFKQSSDIVRKMKKQIITVVLAYDNSNYAKDLIIESEKSMNINGFDFVKTNAYIDTEADMGVSGNKINLVIYSTIKNGYPIYIAGVDLTKEQESISEIEKTTDMIAATFREPEE